MALKVGTFAWLSALVFAVGCSSTPTGGGFGGDGTGSPSGGGDGTGQNSGGGPSSTPGGSTSTGPGTNGATGTSSGTQSSGSGSGGTSVSSSSGSGSGSGSQPSSSSSGSSGGAASSGGSGSSSGAAMATNGRGCGQGTSCTPGNDLAAPAASEGFQFVLPPGGIQVPPGSEQYWCYYKTIPGSAAITIGKFQSWMTQGSSHHFITFSSAGGQVDGTLATCGGGAGQWVYATSVSGQVIELKMPDGVGLPMAANSQLILNLHVINTGSTTTSPNLKLNVFYAQNVMYQAGTMISFNSQINVPAGTTTNPGTQTVGGNCNAPVGSKFFVITTHTHKHATVTDVNYIHGGQTQNIVHTTDYENPDVGLWNAPNFLTVQAGDSFSYSCSYSNTNAFNITVGETAASNEMCMAIGYYFPAGAASCL